MKSALAGVAISAALMGVATSFASPSYADDSLAFQFGDYNHAVICNLVGQEPTPHGIWAANSYLLTVQEVDLNLSYGKMQKAIGYAINNYCPEYRSIYSAYRSRYP